MIKKLFFSGNEQKLSESVQVSFTFPEKIVNQFPEIFRFFKVRSQPQAIPVVFKKKSELPADGFKISLNSKKATILFSNRRGMLYGLTTFLAKISAQDVLSAFKLSDYPSLSFRGFSLDISRGAIPTLQTFRQLIFLLFLLRYNHLALYIEDTLENSILKKYFPENEILKLAELAEIKKLCRRYAITLYPELQFLGHLEKILAHFQLRRYADSDDPASIDAANAHACRLIDAIGKKNIQAFSSTIVNIGFDEVEKISPEKKTKRLKEVLHLLHGCRPALWADQFLKNPDLLLILPPQTLLFNWNYFALKPGDFEKSAAQLASFDQVLCPAVRCWLKFFPDYEKSFLNIAAAVLTAKKKRLAGTLLTLWGDGGNETIISLAQPAIIYNALLSWHAAGFKKKIRLIQKEFPAAKISQLDRALPFTHRYYLYEDPLSAPYSYFSGFQKVILNYSRALKKVTGSAPFPEQKLLILLLTLLIKKVDLSKRFSTGKNINHLLLLQKIAEVLSVLNSFSRLYRSHWKRYYKPQGLGFNLQKFSAIKKRLLYLNKLLKNRTKFDAYRNQILSSRKLHPEQTPDWNQIFNQ